MPSIEQNFSSDPKLQLIDRRAISKKHDTEGRQATAKTIDAVGTKRAILRNDIKTKEADMGERETLAQQQSELKKAKILELKKHSETLVARLRSALEKLGVRDAKAENIRAKIAAAAGKIEELQDQNWRTAREMEGLKSSEAELPTVQQLLEAYYKKMETVPLSNEEKRELLKPENLAALSLEEYIKLWRRLNPHFLSHVTRQGFRDHNAMVYHSGGMQEFHDGFTSVLQDGKLLRPPLAVRDGLRARDEATVKQFLSKWVLTADNEDEAKDRLNSTLNFSLATAPNYPDKTAVHFAAQIVADAYYGGEEDNEILFLYPTDTLASQHNFAFNGSEKDFTQPQNETKWNDIFVWPNSLDNPGIMVDAGIVFLPENTPVDPKTGSKYASKIEQIDGAEQRMMIEDDKLVAAFVSWAKNLNDESPVIKAYQDYTRKEIHYVDEREHAQKTCYDVFRREIMNLGFSEEAAMAVTRELFRDCTGINQYQYDGKIGFGESKEAAALEKLRAAGANWKRVETTITAKQYWETFFSENPQQRPKHIVYYNGDPTAAIAEFQRLNNIGQADVSKTEGVLLGFEDRHIAKMKTDPRANQGYDELVTMAHGIIAEHYGTKRTE